MSAKVVLIFCTQALLLQVVLSQCINNAAIAGAPAFAAFDIAAPYDIAALGLAGPYGLAAPGLASPAFAAPALNAQYGVAPALSAPCGLATPAIEVTPTSGGGLIVTSSSAVAPVGIAVVSENAFEGLLSVIGELPFVSSVDLEGVLPTSGAGAVNHACGNGINAMVSDGEAFAPGYGAAAFAPAYGAAAIAPAGYGAALASAYGPAAFAPAAAFAPGAAAFAPGIAVPALNGGCGCAI